MTSPVQCFSSQAMTWLLTNRNPEGTERNWTRRNGDFPAMNPQQLTAWRHRAIGTSFALPLLALAATVESIAYAVLLVPTAFFNKGLFSHCLKLLNSSYFTCKWALFTLVDHNINRYNVSTHESLARINFDEERVPFGPYERTQDRRYYRSIYPPVQPPPEDPADLLPIQPQEQRQRRRAQPQPEVQPRVPPRQVPQPVHAQPHIPEDDFVDALTRIRIQEAIQAGVFFFQSYLLSDAELVEPIKDFDPDYCTLVLTKAIFICVAGEAASHPIPDFFKEDTKKRIDEARVAWGFNEDAKAVVQVKLHTLELFNEPIEDEKAAEFFRTLNDIAGKEISGLFVKQCWGEAIGKGPIAVLGNPFA